MAHKVIIGRVWGNPCGVSMGKELAKGTLLAGSRTYTDRDTLGVQMRAPDYEEEGIKLYQGDCLELLKKIPDKSVDLMLTDPPYGMEFRSNHRTIKYDKIVGDDRYPVEVLNEFFRIAKKAVYVFCRWDNLSELPKPKSVLVWVKNNWSMGDLKHEHGRQWEAICFYPQEEHEFIERIPDVIKCPRTENVYHPTQKPVGIIRRIIETNKGATILDPFMGSGTTGIACINTGRDFIGIEKESEYFEIAQRRINDLQNNRSK